MNDDTATTSGPQQPERVCASCQKSTTKAVVVGEIHGASGPGRTLYACPDCAPRYPRLTSPMASLDAALKRGRKAGGGQRP